MCKASEKVLQLTRILLHEVSVQQSSQFIVYFATGACVDYFYSVSLTIIFVLMFDLNERCRYSKSCYLPSTLFTRYTVTLLQLPGPKP